jgi:hypothetical protein
VTVGPVRRSGLAIRLLLVLALLNLGACSTYQTVDVTPGVQGFAPFGVEVGRLVRVTTLSGERAEFRITEMDETGIGGSEGFFRYDRMRTLELQAPGNSNDKTLSIVLAIIGVAALVALIANADSVTACSPGPCDPPQGF